VESFGDVMLKDSLTRHAVTRNDSITMISILRLPHVSSRVPGCPGSSARVPPDTNRDYVLTRPRSCHVNPDRRLLMQGKLQAASCKLQAASRIMFTASTEARSDPIRTQVDAREKADRSLFPMSERV
jgi:hypothetical protein